MGKSFTSKERRGVLWIVFAALLVTAAGLVERNCRGSHEEKVEAVRIEKNPADSVELTEDGGIVLKRNDGPQKTKKSQKKKKEKKPKTKTKPVKKAPPTRDPLSEPIETGPASEPTASAPSDL